MSALDLALGRARPAKAKKKRKSKSRAAAVSTEYSLLLTATLCLLAFGAVMVFSASSTTQVLQNGGLADSAYYLQRTLIVGIKGSYDDYCDLPQQTFESFMTAPSMGQFFNANIRGSGPDTRYDCRMH